MATAALFALSKYWGKFQKSYFFYIDHISTTEKNERNMKSVSQEKLPLLPYFQGIFKL